MDMTGDRNFAMRFRMLRGDMSYRKLSDEVYAKTGIRISAQALHRYAHGSLPTAANLRALAAYWQVSESWLAYGETPRNSYTLEDAIMALPRDAQRATLDFLAYQLEHNRSKLMTRDPAQADYLITMVETRLRRKDPP